jgi:hypothetical protein
MVSFPQVSPTKILYASLLSSIRVTCPTHSIFLDFITLIILGEECISLSSSLCTSLHSSYCPATLRLKYSPPHLIFKHPHPTFFPQYERSSYILIQNNRHTYSYVYLSFIFFDSYLQTKDSAPNDSKRSLTSVCS